MGLRTQQMRTIKHMNMDICNGWDCTDGMWPKLEPVYDIPNGLRTFCISESWKNPDKYVHFFIDDYRFERIWERPHNYDHIISRYAGAIAPDFSTYTDMPVPMQIWNVYRSRAMAYHWQQQGISVIPNIQFSDELSYEWVFDGLPHKSVLAASTVGVYKNPEYRRALIQGMEEACRVLEPKSLIMYGTKVEFDTNGANVHWYKNDNTERVRENYKRIQEAQNGS